MTLDEPSILSAILIICGVIGVVVFIASVWFWQKIEPFTSDLITKIAAKFIQLVSLYSGIRGAYEVGADKANWLMPVIAGAVCLVLWEVIEKIVDYKIKAKDKLDKAALAAAEAEIEARTELITVFRLAVRKKLHRLIKMVKKRSNKPSAAQVRKALTPETHLEELINSLVTYFSQQLSDEQAASANFRVGLYVCCDGIMVPIQAISLNNTDYDVFGSYKNHQESFKLTCTEKPSHVVNCANQRRTIIVEDCAEAATRGEFHFFNEQQKSYLKSLLAYYLADVTCEDGIITMGVLSIDTDVPGFFTEAKRKTWDFCLREFATRFKLEMLLHAVLVQRSEKE